MDKVFYYPDAVIPLPRVGICPSCEEQRPFALSDESFAPGSVCPNCGHVETDETLD